MIKKCEQLVPVLLEPFPVASRHVGLVVVLG